MRIGAEVGTGVVCSGKGMCGAFLRFHDAELLLSRQRPTQGWEAAIKPFAQRKQPGCTTYQGAEPWEAILRGRHVDR